MKCGEFFYAQGFVDMAIDFFAGGLDANVKRHEPETGTDIYVRELKALDEIAEAIDENDPLKPDSIRLSAKQEAFALSYIETGSAGIAYALAYGTRPGATAKEAKATAARRGAELLEHPLLQARMLELHRTLREKTGVTVEYLTGQFREAIDLAKRTEKAAAFVQAINGLMKLHGLGLERKEITVTDTLRKMSSAELLAYEAELDAELKKLKAAGKQTAPGSKRMN